MGGDMSDERLLTNQELVKSEEVEQEGEARHSKEEATQPESGIEERKECEPPVDTTSKKDKETLEKIIPETCKQETESLGTSNEESKSPSARQTPKDNSNIPPLPLINEST